MLHFCDGRFRSQHFVAYVYDFSYFDSYMPPSPCCGFLEARAMDFNSFNILETFNAGDFLNISKT